ncbi:MAG: efflux RND transporter permease subunit, partial [Lachnospiraceae bacterium]|nr:efflux RND transporter permease subunit [Lachnospiraceae bacterium]
MFSRASIKRPVTTVMVMLIVVLGGLIGYKSLNLDLMPSMDIPVAIVSTTYVGAGPEEIETLITKPLEEALGTVSNVDEITSTSSANSSMIIVEFEDDTDIDLAAVDMREKVDLIKSTLPEGAKEPMVLKIDINSMTAITVGIKSDTLNLTELNTLTEDTLSKRFEKIEGVTSVSITGGVENEIEITVNPEKLHGYGVTVAQISQALALENLDYPAGTVQQGTLKLQVKSVGLFKTIDEIRDLPITTATGGIIHIRDVADVNMVEKEQSSYAIMDGEPALMLVIQKQSNANLVQVSDKVNAEIAKVCKDYPQVSLSMLTDTADYIKLSVNNIISTAIQAAVLAIIVIFIFLRSSKMALIVGISIPTSIIATFAVMWLNGMTLNMISTGGIAIGIGMLVDNSIVVLENIFSHARQGEPIKEASAKGASEIAMAVTASTLTTVGVFVPLMFVSGTTGDIFKDLSLTICFALGASLVVSLTFVPMACSKLLKPEQFIVNDEDVQPKKKRHFTKLLDVWGRGLEKLDSGYRKILLWCLVNKKKVVALVVAIFIGTLALVPIMGMDFMPTMDEGVITASIELPDGTVLEETQRIVDEVITHIEKMDEAEMFYATIGSSGMFFSASGTNMATMTVNLVNKKDRELSAEDLAKNLEDELKSIPGCEITVSSSDSAMGSYGGSGVTLQISGDENDELREISNNIENMIKDIDGITDISNSAGDTLPETKITINREKASGYGITSTQIYNAVNNAISGKVATQFKIDGSEIDVRIKQKDESVKYMNDLENLTITTASGIVVPITEVADITKDESSVAVTRKNHHKYTELTATVYGRDMKSVQKDIEAKLSNFVMPDGYSYEFTGTTEEMNKSFMQLGLVLIVAILLVYMIMASQFESLIYPFIVMFSMPIAITGGIFGLFVTGKS